KQITIPETFTGDVDMRPETLRAYSEDKSIFTMRPQCVVYPRDAADLSILVRYAREHGAVSLTPWSAGTDMSGGPLTDSIVVDLTRYFDRIHHVERARAHVQPGVYYRDF